jgi:hypothetical protein
VASGKSAPTKVWPVNPNGAHQDSFTATSVEKRTHSEMLKDFMAYYHTTLYEYWSCGKE